MGTKKISQLETISDSNLSGEAILPVVVSDPLIPNRKAKINQLHKGVSGGSKSDPGLCFDLDRDTGLYQNAYDQIGLGFGNGGLYMSRIDNGGSYTIQKKSQRWVFTRENTASVVIIETTGLMALNEDDRIRVYVWHNHGSNRDLDDNFCLFEVFRLGD